MEELPPSTPPAPAPAPPPPPHRASSGFGEKDDHVVERKTLRDYYIILRERLWIALPVAILAAVGYGYYQMRETPMYSATATIQYEHAETVTLGKGIVDTSLENQIDLNNKLSVLRSGLLAKRVFDSITPAEI